ncbi:uncharacterized protein ACR2FA_006383 [Aphomia sociella]
MTDHYFSKTRSSMVRPTPADLPRFLSYACKQLQAPFGVKVIVQTQAEYVSKTEEKSKKIGKSTTRRQSSFVESQEMVSDYTSAPTTFRDEYMVLVTAMTDAADHLIELIFYRCIDIPRLLIKVIGMCISYQRYLYKITLRWGPLTGPTLYELAKFLPLSQITELCLDDSPVEQRNYYMLLEQQTLLRCLSLARCNLDDDDCAIIASKLIHPLPAARSLVMLSLASNFISDDGARALGAALRSNRTLQYLNLSGNQIGDDSAASIFRSLVEFPLTCDELIARRKRLLNYLKLKQETYTKCYNELTTTLLERSRDDYSRGGRRRTITSARSRKSNISAVTTRASVYDTVALNAEAMTDELLRTYSEPFSFEETVSRDKNIHSMGNATLCYLNLGYNQLSYVSAVRLLRVLTYQATRRSGPGLMRVPLGGNAMPAARELFAAQELLDKAVLLKLAAKQQKRSERSVKSAKSK